MCESTSRLKLKTLRRNKQLRKVFSVGDQKCLEMLLLQIYLSDTAGFFESHRIFKFVAVILQIFF